METKVLSGVWMDRIPKEQEVQTLFLFNAIINKCVAAIDAEDLQESMNFLYSKYLTSKYRPLLTYGIEENGMHFYQEEIRLIHIPFDVDLDLANE